MGTKKVRSRKFYGAFECDRGQFVSAALSTAGLVALVVSLIAFSANAADKLEHRVLHFSKDLSLGILRAGPMLSCAERSERTVGYAKGDIALNLPSDYGLSLEPSGKAVMRNPQLLEAMAKEPLDGIRVECYSMDDNEEGVSDRLLQHAAKCKNLKVIYADRSDATDQGLKAFNNNPAVLRVSCFQTECNGEFLKTMAVGCPNLQMLRLKGSNIHHENFRYLQSFKKLSDLDVSGTGLADADVADIAKCKSVIALSCHVNPFGDKGVACLNSLTDLRYLNLGLTKVTIKGLRSLKSLKKLVNLGIPVEIPTTYDAEIHRQFPLVKSIERGKPIDTLSKQDYPLLDPRH